MSVRQMTTHNRKTHSLIKRKKQKGFSMSNKSDFSPKTGEPDSDAKQLDEKRIELKAILESNLCLGLAPNREYEGGKER